MMGLHLQRRVLRPSDALISACNVLSTLRMHEDGVLITKWQVHQAFGANPAWVSFLTCWYQ